MIIHVEENTISFLSLLLLLVLLSLAVTQAAAVGPVLRVHKQLHLELGSQHRFSCRLLFLLYGFDLCLG